MKHHLREWKHLEVDLVVLKTQILLQKSWRGNIDESVINSPQSQFTTERNGEMKFEIFLGNAQFQIPDIVHCPPFNFFNISLLPSRNLFKKKLCSFAYNSLDLRWIWFCQLLKQQENLWYLGYWNTNHLQKGKFTVRDQNLFISNRDNTIYKYMCGIVCDTYTHMQLYTLCAGWLYHWKYLRKLNLDTYNSLMLPFAEF